jgi:hypothetical protein
MRYYAFANMYINGVHTGIQAGHALDQMWLKYTEMIEQRVDLYTPIYPVQFAFMRTFSKDHMTFVYLNGGDHEMLSDLFGFISTNDGSLPFQLFREPGLNNAITAVGIILPETLYDEYATAVGNAAQSAMNVEGSTWIKELEDNKRYTKKFVQVILDRNYSAWDVEFLRRKGQCKMAV